MWLNIFKIVDYWWKLPPSKRPSSKSYLAVKKAVEDNLIVTKLSFFSCIASLLQPYLTKYQTNKLPFLGKVLKRMHRVLLQLFVKPDVLDKCVSVVNLLKVNLSNPDTYLKVKNRYFGFSAKE